MTDNLYDTSETAELPIEDIPLPNEWVDVVISNCVINLSAESTCC